MSNFFGLVHNENVKIYARVRTWIMLGIVALTALLMPALIHFVSSDVGFWGAMNTLLLFSFLPTVFAIAVAADSVAGEFARGTIKLLLIRPWSRSKVLLAKYLSVLLFMLALYALFAGLALLMSALLFGTEPAAANALAQAASGMGEYFWWSLLYGLIDSLIYVTMAFMFSTVFRSNSLAVALTIVLLFMGDLVTLLIDPAKYAVGRYLLFANMNLAQYIGSENGQYGVMTFGFSAAVLAIYYIAFLVLAFRTFRKRDVAA